MLFLLFRWIQLANRPNPLFVIANVNVVLHVSLRALFFVSVWVFHCCNCPILILSLIITLVNLLLLLLHHFSFDYSSSCFHSSISDSPAAACRALAPPSAHVCSSVFLVSLRSFSSYYSFSTCFSSSTFCNCFSCCWSSRAAKWCYLYFHCCSPDDIVAHPDTLSTRLCWRSSLVLNFCSYFSCLICWRFSFNSICSCSWLLLSSCSLCCSTFALFVAARLLFYTVSAVQPLLLLLLLLITVTFHLLHMFLHLQLLCGALFLLLRFFSLRLHFLLCFTYCTADFVSTLIFNYFLRVLLITLLR